MITLISGFVCTSLWMNRIFQRVFFWTPIIILIIIIIAVIISIIAMTTSALPPPISFIAVNVPPPGGGELAFYLLIKAQACPVGVLPFHGPNKPSYPSPE